MQNKKTPINKITGKYWLSRLPQLENIKTVQSVNRRIIINSINTK